MGDKNAVDGAGTEAMRTVLNSLDIRGTVVIGEDEMDETPTLYIGERLDQGRYDTDSVHSRNPHQVGFWQVVSVG